MSKLFLMSDEETNRILNLHENAILKEKILGKKYSKLLTEDEETLPEYGGGVPKSKVELVQQALVDLGYDLGDFGSKEDGVDGNFGSKTKAAVIKFQTDKGISPNKGIVGPKTAAALGVEPLTTGQQTTPSTGTETPSTGAGSTSSSPFKTREEGNAFRKWMNDNYASIAREFKLDREGSHTNDYIKNAFNKKIPGNTSYTWGKLYQAKTGSGTQPGNTQPDRITKNISPFYKYHFDLDRIDSTKSKKNILPADTLECGEFVNNFSTKVGFVGNAWNAHDYEPLGPRIKTGYRGLDDTQVDTVFNIFNAIRRAGGPDEENGPQSENIKKLTQQLIPSITPSDLKIDDIVGIFYPNSSYFEKAFYQAAFSGFDEKTVPPGKGYFVKDGSGKFQKGKTISGGDAFGMNTHVGIVGAIKDGVPIIFHNISGIIHTDPYNKLVGDGKIMWIRRPA